MNSLTAREAGYVFTKRIDYNRPMPESQGRVSRLVLLVEDDPRQLEQTRRILSAEGYEVSCARDAAAALLFLNGTRVFDLLVADIVLPDLSGLDLARRLRQMRPTAAVLLTSGYGRAWAQDAMPEGAAFLAKPFSGEELVTEVRALLSRTS